MKCSKCGQKMPPVPCVKKGDLIQQTFGALKIVYTGVVTEVRLSDFKYAVITCSNPRSSSEPGDMKSVRFDSTISKIEIIHGYIRVDSVDRPLLPASGTNQHPF